MVSFQCNGCGDVCTKPKLDKHRAACHASFDCIDCSKRFETPADYKGHTSCISEAEKYQKTSYNGGKQTGPEKNGRNQGSRQQGGGRQWGNNRRHWQQRSVNQATGANDTPLGTPVRMSPVNDIPAVEESSKKRESAVETPKKRKAETTESMDTSEPAKKKKKKQETIEDVRETIKTAETKFVEPKSRAEPKSAPEISDTERQLQDNSPQPGQDASNPQEVSEKKRKKKKESKAKEEKRCSEEVKEKKKKDKRRKEEGSSSPTQELTAMLETKLTASTAPSVTEVPPANEPEKARSTKKSKSKGSKSKMKATTAEEAPDVTASATSRPAAAEAGVARDDQGNRKKKLRTGNDSKHDHDAKRVAQGNNEDSKEKRKEKKKKRRSDGPTASLVE